jgi:hypothetical protein
MALRKLLRNRGLGVNLIAGFSFLLLAVYGWGLSWKDLGVYLLAILVLLIGLIALASVCGWLLRKAMGKGDPFQIDEGSTTHNEDGDARNTEVSTTTEEGTHSKR